MGCGGSKNKGNGAKSGGPPAAKINVKVDATPKKKLDPKDYMFSKRTGETLVKEEGTINGEQFNVEECKNCDIFLLDHVATAFIDECENCRIFVGPVESSVFVRNCKDCNVMLACQQFRSRDCTNCKFSLFCTTEPIIETSSDIQFACFDFFYFSLRDQLSKAKLPLWNNKWWQIHDFNKNAANPNWSILPEEEVPKLLHMDKCSCISAEELAMDHVVPVTLGSRPWPCEESSFVLFLPNSDLYIEAFLAKAAKTDGWTLCRTRSTVLPDDRLKSLLGWAKEPKLLASLKGKEVTGVQVCGPGIAQQVQEALSSTGLAAGAKNIRIIPAPEIQTLGKAFFEVWKDDI